MGIQKTRSGGSGVRQLFLANEGVGTIEFALVALFLSFMLLGIIDFGLSFWEQMQVNNAAGAGADYVIQNGYTSAADVRSAAMNATNLAGIGASSSTSCGCPTSTGVITVSGTYPSCGASCSGVGGTGTSGPYVTITASVSYSTLFSWPGVANPITLSATTLANN